MSPTHICPQKMVSGSMSPKEGSPFGTSASSRLFWKGRETPSIQNSDTEASLNASRRRSIEDLKRVSRVRNSRIFARDQNNENDPPQASMPQKSSTPSRRSSQRRSQNELAQDFGRAGLQQSSEGVLRPSSKDQASPAKSSLSKGSRFGSKGLPFDPEKEIWLDGQRHLKSVTFDAAPPQVNEYEMSTPDPSTITSGSHDGSDDSEEDEGEISFDQDSSIDRDDSFDASLEDIEKTPVVLPEDWRFMSPDSEDDEIVQEDEDPFTEHVEDPARESARNSHVESQDSSSERRPLPPLPSTRIAASPRPSSAGSLFSGAEIGGFKQRTLPPRPGTAPHGQSNGDNHGQAFMSLEDKFRMLELEKNSPKMGPSNHVEPNDEGTTEKENGVGEEKEEEANQKANSADRKDRDAEALDELNAVGPRISRESILRDIRKGDSFSDESFECSSQIDTSTQYYDPDVPIPTLEEDNEDMETSVIVKKNEEQDDDIYDIPDYYEDHHDEQTMTDNEHDENDDDQSQYSQASAVEHNEQDMHHSNASIDSQATAIVAGNPEKHTEEHCTNADNQVSESQEAPAPNDPANDGDIRRSETPPGKIGSSPNDEPSTPDSVIRHDVEDRPSSPSKESVPDPLATVKAPGGSLKTRPSLTPADLASMAATRRKVSGQEPPPMPYLRNQPSSESENSDDDDERTEPKDPLQDTPQLSPPVKNEPQRQSSLVKLDIPFSIQEESLGFGLDREFDRVMETQKVAFEQALTQHQHSIPYFSTGSQAIQPRNPQDFNYYDSGLAADPRIPKQRGYLMRQNTKVIVASSNSDDETAPSADGTPAGTRGSRSKNQTPRKPSQQTWTKVPLNTQSRRASAKGGSNIPRKKPAPGPVPPLPGQASNVQDVQEAVAAAEANDPALTETVDEGEERGRLFVKVVGIKYLDLPLPRGMYLCSLLFGPCVKIHLTSGIRRAILLRLDLR